MADFYKQLALDLFTTVAFISVIANILVVFVVVKFRKLRNDVTSVIIAHISVLQMFFLIMVSSTWRISPLYKQSVICTMFKISYILAIVICLCVLLLICDWYFKLYCEQKYAKFCWLYKFLLAAVYVTGTLLSVVITRFCSKRMEFYSPAFFTVTAVYSCLVLFLVAMNIVHLVKRRKFQGQEKNCVGLLVANIFCMFPLPFLLMCVLFYFHIRCVEVLTSFLVLGTSSPVFNLVYLFYWDDSFNLFLKKVVKCECNDYKNDPLEDQAVAYSEKNGVQIH